VNLGAAKTGLQDARELYLFPCAIGWIAGLHDALPN